jgi:alpha-beta hydrolase superfamily lysophospholipase
MTYFFKSLFLLCIISLSTLSCKTNNKDIDSISVGTVSTKATLIKHTVLSNGHPIAVWEKQIDNAKGIVLFVHGRTWSGVPDFDLQVKGEELSLMDGLNAQGYTTYAIDLRGYGETPRDSTAWATPIVSAKDVTNIIKWISEQNNNTKVHLFGWSMGSTISLLAAQNEASNIASLTVFGFWMDLDVKIPEDPVPNPLQRTVNNAKAAASDFITPGNISQKAIDTYVKVALKSDPIRVDWKHLNEYNTINPSLLELPVLILQGEFDPIAPTDRQAKLFTRLKTADKSWVVISGGDHAAFMETPRPHFIEAFTGFINRFNR